jgi:hypothetical protein
MPGDIPPPPAARGGRRPRSGRPRTDNVRIECSVPRVIYNELLRCEAESGTYRTRLAAALIAEGVLGRSAARDLKRWPC